MFSNTSGPHVVLVSCSSCIGETLEEFSASMFLTFLQYLDIFQQVKCNGLSSLTIQVHWKIEKNMFIIANQRVFSGKLTNKRAVNNCQLPHPQWPSFRKMITKVGCCPDSVRVINSPTIMATKCFGSSP